MTATDAAGQTTSYLYNPFGQPLQITNAKGEKTTLTYSHDDGFTTQNVEVTDGYLMKVTGALPGASTSFGYDGFGRVQDVTDSEGYKVGLSHDALNRVTRRAYPDGTSEQILYENLDPRWTCDRLGRWTQLLHDRMRHLTVVIDPLIRPTKAVSSCHKGRDNPGKNAVSQRIIRSR